MPEPDQAEKLSKIRNIGIIAHIDAGKTTTTERILYHSGKIHKIGEVHDREKGKGATMDFDPQERERGITIQSAATTVYWKNHQINIIDTPGHVDFTAEVERSLRVLDGGIVVMDGKKGVEAQTETVWRQANKYKIPRLIFINKLDSVDGIEKFDENLKSIREKFNTVPLTVQFPIGAGKDLAGVIDIVEQKAYYCQMGNQEEVYQVKTIPAELVNKAQKYRQELIETIVGYDEKLGLKYIEGEELQVGEIKQLLRQATLSGQHFPVFCGSAYKYVGVKLVLDGVVDYLPSPLDIPEIPVFSPTGKNRGEEKVIMGIKTKMAELEKSLNNLNLALSNQKKENKLTDQTLQVVKFEMEEELIRLRKQLQKEEPNQVNCNSPLSCLALVFKIVFDENNNRLTFVRVYAGKILTNSSLYNVNQNKIEKVSKNKLVRMHANKQENIDEVGAGDIAVIKGLKYTITGDTLGEEKTPLLLEAINFAEPVISQAIEPKTNEDRDKLSDALGKLKIQDPSFRYWTDRETRQMIIAGMGELHLEVSVERLRREYKLNIEAKQRKVSYRETIKEEFEIDEKGNKIHKKIKIHHLHKKQTGGAGQRAEVDLEFKSNPGGGFKFVNALRGERVGKGNCFVPAIERGLLSVFSNGPLLGYPVVDVEVTLTDGAYHPIDSSDLAFETAGRDAFRENIDKFNLILLEPIMQLEVIVPKDYMGEVLADLGSRRASVENTEEKEGNAHITGKTPLKEILNYSTTLRQITKGRGTYLMHLSHYQETPKDVLEAILKEEKL